MWTSDLGNGRYKNPILYADYSDPDAIRVGEDYFLTASSFNHIPGLPLLHSKDLINWSIINHGIQRLPWDKYNMPQYGCGVWAPSIRYHDGLFRILFPTPDEGIFEIHTDDPWGKWSSIHCVKEAKGWIDPCPFWDDDGQAYMVFAYAGSRAGISSIIAICPMSWDGLHLLDDTPVHVFDGHETQHTIEGPKLYKRNGFYYIFCPAGGVSTGWQTILRSKHIYGPYEEKIVLHQGSSWVNGPHQGAWVDTPAGEDWFLHFQELQPYGRILHLQPMCWEEDWPIIGVVPEGAQVGEPVPEWKKPALPAQPVAVPQTSDSFEKGCPGLQWQWNANPETAWLGESEKGLVLRATLKNMPRLWDVPNLLLQKYPAPSFCVELEADLRKLGMGDEFGLAFMGEEYSALCIIREVGQWRVSIRSGSGVSGLPRAGTPVPLQPKSDDYTHIGSLPAQGVCTFTARADASGNCRFSVRSGERELQCASAKAMKRAPLFIGARFGCYLLGGAGLQGSAAIAGVTVYEGGETI